MVGGFVQPDPALPYKLPPFCRITGMNSCLRSKIALHKLIRWYILLVPGTGMSLAAFRQ